MLSHQLFDFNNILADVDEDVKEPSDSEDSVYSGLEDSGSDSDEDCSDDGEKDDGTQQVHLVNVTRL